MRLVRLLGGFAAVAAVAASLAVAGPAHAASEIECQHPVITGVEVSSLSHVTSARACPVALSLWKWENKDNNGSKLYTCAPMVVLKLKTYDGWSLSLNKAGFKMSRGTSSFYVSGTDFPIACN
jgi:hypothetical protein